MMRPLTLRDLREETTPTGEEGRWVTIRGRPIFIGGISDEALDALEVPDEAPAKDRQETPKFKKDGSPVLDSTGKPLVDVQYSREWREAAIQYKFARVNKLAAMQDEIESSLVDEIESEGITSHAGCVAACLLLMSKTGMRTGGGGPGAATDKKTKKKIPTYGATSIQRRHVTIEGDTVTFSYIGKKGVKRLVRSDDPDLVSAVRGLMRGADRAPRDNTPLFTPDIPPGSRAKNPKPVRPEHLNARLKRHDRHFIAYNFRHLKGTRAASDEVQAMLSGPKPRIPQDPKKREKKARELIARVADAVSRTLGNERSAALTGYTNPYLIEHMLEQSGFKPDMFGQVQKAYRISGFDESVDDAVKDLVETRSKLPILRALLGSEAVDSWQGLWADDSLPEDSPVRERAAILESDDQHDPWERICEMAGLWR